jgi:hypothetical protein
MKYNDALKIIDPVSVLEALDVNRLCQGAYVRFECDCGSQAAAFKTVGDKKNLWYCPECKKGGNIINYTMAKKGTEYEETKKWLVKLSPTTKRLTKELKLEYELQYTEAVQKLGLIEETCKALEIGVPKGKTMLAGCLTFTIRNENGLKVAYYGIRLKNGQPVHHKSFNREHFLYGYHLVNQDKKVTLVEDMVDCAKRIVDSQNAICNFGLPYLSPVQCELINKLDKIDLEVTPNMALSLASQLSTYYRFVTE